MNIYDNGMVSSNGNSDALVMGLAINNIKSEHTLYFVLDFMILFLLSPSSGTAKNLPALCVHIKPGFYTNLQDISKED